MATYLLIHGGDCTGGIWQSISHNLEVKGHQVYSPSMRSVTVSTLTENIREVTAYVELNRLENFIVVAHSYGAMVMTGLLQNYSDKIQQMVFIDSAVPKNGCSLYGLFERHGYSYKDLGLTPDPACMETIEFDEGLLTSQKKTYIHCLQSEFLKITDIFYQEIKDDSHWLIFCLDTLHDCLSSRPDELAVILHGLSG